MGQKKHKLPFFLAPIMKKTFIRKPADLTGTFTPQKSTNKNSQVNTHIVSDTQVNDSVMADVMKEIAEKETDHIHQYR